MECIAGADVESEAAGEFPSVLYTEFDDAITGADLPLLEVDLEVIDLAEEEAGDRVAAIGYALLIGTCAGKRKSAGWVRRCDGVQLVPAEIEPEFELVRSAGPGKVVDCLPDGGLILREGAGRRTELLEAGEGEERE